jgi:hypothetical protein
VTELGKGDFTGRNPDAVARWKKLHTVSPALREAMPNREVIRDSILAAPAEAWDTIFAQVNGSVPLAELQKAGEVIYLQGEVNVTRAGPVEIHLNAPGAATLWIDEDAHEKPGKLAVPLAVGRHRFTIRLVGSDNPRATLRLEVRGPADSTARFEIVQGE